MCLEMCWNIPRSFVFDLLRNKVVCIQAWIHTTQIRSLIIANSIILMWSIHHGFESRWSLDFFRLLLSNCLNWKIYYDDHSSLWIILSARVLVAIGSHVFRFTPPHRYKHCSVNNCLPFLFNNSVPKEFSTVGDALFWSCFITNPKIGEKLKLTPLPLLRSSLSLELFKLLHFLLFRISSPDWLCSGEDPSFFDAEGSSI